MSKSVKIFFVCLALILVFKVLKVIDHNVEYKNHLTMYSTVFGAQEQIISQQQTRVDKTYDYSNARYNQDVIGYEQLTAITYANFTGQDYSIEGTIDSDKNALQLLGEQIEQGIYTVIPGDNIQSVKVITPGTFDLITSDLGPLYNIPIYDQTRLIVTPIDKQFPVSFSLVAQDDYQVHDQSHQKGLFITGISIFDNQISADYNAMAYYPQIVDNQYQIDCIPHDDDIIFDVPGSYFLIF